MDTAVTEQSARTIVKALIPGRIVSVYVDPADPAYALMQGGFFPYLAWWALLDVVSLIVGLIGLMWVVRSKRAGGRSIPNPIGRAS